MWPLISVELRVGVHPKEPRQGSQQQRAGQRPLGSLPPPPPQRKRPGSTFRRCPWPFSSLSSGQGAQSVSSGAALFPPHPGLLCAQGEGSPGLSAWLRAIPGKKPWAACPAAPSSISIPDWNVHCTSPVRLSTLRKLLGPVPHGSACALVPILPGSAQRPPKCPSWGYPLIHETSMALSSLGGRTDFPWRLVNLSGYFCKF